MCVVILQPWELCLFMNGSGVARGGGFNEEGGECYSLWASLKLSDGSKEEAAPNLHVCVKMFYASAAIMKNIKLKRIAKSCQGQIVEFVSVSAVELNKKKQCLFFFKTGSLCVCVCVFKRQCNRAWRAIKAR